jgi:hypothetical protein
LPGSANPPPELAEHFLVVDGFWHTREYE